MKSKFKLFKKLPDTLGELLKVALDDYVHVKKLKTYSINMSQWHSPIESLPGVLHIIHQDSKATCAVCLAGCVLVRNSVIKPDEYAVYSDFDSDTKHKLLALNELRQFDLIPAARYFLYSKGNEYYEANHEKYAQFNTKHRHLLMVWSIAHCANWLVPDATWLKDMRKLQKMLMKEGL